MAAARPLPGKGIGWWLRAADFAPAWDPAWLWATDHAKRQFWLHGARLAIEEYGLSREMGIDRFGEPLVPISEYTREHRRSAMVRWADPDAPPLIPGHGRSRTVGYLRSRYVPGRGVWFWWIYDPRVRDSWGQILQYHATGRARGPVRDVLDLDPAARARVREALWAWWMARRAAAANLRVTELPDEGLAIPMPAGPPRVVTPARRAAKPAARSEPAAYTVRRAKVSAVSGTGGEDLGAGTRYIEMRRRNAPAWLRSY